MSVKVTKTPNLKLKLIDNPAFLDFRGSYTELFNWYDFTSKVEDSIPQFLQDDAISSSV